MKRILFFLLFLLSMSVFGQSFDVKYGTFRQYFLMVPMASPPSAPVKGMAYMDTDGQMYVYNGSAWVSGASQWSLSGSDITNTNAGFVIVDSLFKIYPRPNQVLESATNPYQFLVMGNDGWVHRVTPVTASAIIEDTIADRAAAGDPPVTATWVRDSIEKELTPANVGDDVSNYKLTGKTIISSQKYDLIYVLREDPYYWFRYNVGSYDIAEKWQVMSTGNSIFQKQYVYKIATTAANTSTAYAAGTLIHGNGDAIAPITLTNLASNSFSEGHGLYVTRLVSTGHNKTAVDSLSIWTDGTTQWYLTGIDADTLTLLPKYYASGASWLWDATINAATLTHVSGATHTGAITVTSQTAVQSYPVHKNGTITVKLDGVASLANNEGSYCHFAEVEDYAEVVDPSSLNIHYPTAYNDGSTWWTRTHTYRFQRGGYYGETRYDFYRPLEIAAWIGMNIHGLYQGTFDDRLLYIPKTKPFTVSGTNYDLINIDTINTVGADFTIDTSRMANKTAMPDRNIQLLKDDGVAAEVGMAAGLITDSYQNDTTQRASNIALSGVSNRVVVGGKNYVYYGDNGFPLIDDTTVYKSYYQVYFDPSEVDSLSWFYTFKAGEFDYLYIDSKAAVSSETIQLPYYVIGKQLQVIESDGVTLDDYNPLLGELTLTAAANSFLIAKMYGDYTPAVWGANGSEITNLNSGDVNITSSLVLPLASSSTTGVIYKNSRRFIHDYQGGTSSGRNIFVGKGAGNFTMSGATTTGSYNVGVGDTTLSSLTNGYGNSTLGYQTGYKITEGYKNTLIGFQTGRTMTTAVGNTGVGAEVFPAGTGSYNTGFGSSSLNALTTGTYNSCFGNSSGLSLQGGTGNTFIGTAAGRSCVSGNYNVIGGYQAGYNSTGSYNTFIGYKAGYTITGDRNVIIGTEAGSAAVAISDKLYIDNSNTSAPLIEGDFSANTLKVNGTRYDVIGTISNNDSTPSFAGGNLWKYNGTANSVSIDAIDDEVVGALYEIHGNSDTYTITVIDGTPAGGDSFNLAGAAWVGGNQDVLLIRCIATGAFVEVSRSDN